MSWLDEMVDEGEVASQEQRLDRTSDKPKPGVFTGALDVVGPNLLRGGLEAGAAVESGLSSVWQGGLEAAASLLLPEPKFGGTPDVTSAERSSQETLGQGTAQAVMDLRPDPAEVGVAGQVLGELAAVLPRTVAGAVFAGPVGAAAAAGAPAGYSRKQVSMTEGIDENTATWLGITEGLTTGAGAILPAARFVGPVLGDAAIAVGANVGLGVAHRGVAAKILESNGYAAQAAQYRMMDGAALATDAVLGLAFFGMGRATFRRPTTEQIDAALTERNAQHADIDTAPGLPINSRSAVAHQEALATAIAQINRGEPVVLPDAIHSAEFLHGSEQSRLVAPTREQALVTARQDTEQAVRTELEAEAAGVLPNVADIRMELAGVRRSLDDLDATFRDRAKEFQEQGQGRKRAETSARQAIDAERSELSGRITALEGSLSGNRTGELARSDLAALARGETPQRLQARIDKRASEIIQGFERKPLAAGVARGNEGLTPRQLNERAAREEIDTLVQEHEATLPPAVTRPAPDLTPAGKNATKPAESATPEAESATNAPKDATRGDGQPGPDAGAEPPELQLLRGAVARNPEAMVHTGYDADGKPISARADEVLAEIEAEHAAGTREANAYTAAITCLLRF
ncbi:hypothetical protein [Pseudomonas donghuensis]|uniref:hypothetical protein n=1 Tax=Pseudomonas donghuensis TaxID=1163398 RepID=UPI00215EB7BF|nr:hypothetical protein [Pseudomonas donghuensis]UVL22387.1 hypothetical protein LOY30_16125 [Pseudomonas donghuensis]